MNRTKPRVSRTPVTLWKMMEPLQELWWRLGTFQALSKTLKPARISTMWIEFDNERESSDHVINDWCIVTSLLPHMKPINIFNDYSLPLAASKTSAALKGLAKNNKRNCCWWWNANKQGRWTEANLFPITSFCDSVQCNFHQHTYPHRKRPKTTFFQTMIFQY